MMRNLLSRDLPIVHTGTQPSIELVASEKLPVLAARRTALCLQDDTLAFLLCSCRVELFAQPFDLFVARTSEVSCALLCASAGCSMLAIEAYIIRKQWPLARIIVLGAAPHDLEDHLYDDAVAANCNAATLATVFSNRSMDVWNRAGGRDTGRLGVQALAESDPTKAERLDLRQLAGGFSRDFPSDERQGLRRALVSRHFVASQA